MKRILSVLLCAGALAFASKPVLADDTKGPQADPTGAYQTTPTALSVPGYTKIANPDTATPAQLSAAVDAVAQSASRSYFSINFVWVLVCGFLVMFMQAGFALVETGLVRRKNAAHTMTMNFLVYAIGMLGFFISGYALMCGGANGSPIGGPGVLGGIPVLDSLVSLPIFGQAWGLFGAKGFFLSGQAYDAMAMTWFLFMMVFMDTTATIPTGALAERWKMKSFVIFSLFVGGLLYPVFGCWVWGGGWIAQLGLNLGLGHGGVDYAGSAVVHLQGGTLALITAAMLGPRLGKYGKDGKAKAIPVHNIPYVVLGTFILAFGWFGFNAGSSLAGTDGRIGIVAVNTMLASAGAACATMLYLWRKTGKLEPTMICNGMLAGLVAITAPCAFVTPLAAVFIGVVSGVLVVWSVAFWDKRGIDDPVGAISVHGVNGLWGVLALGLFADGTYGAGWNGVGATEYLGVAGRGVTGLFYGDSGQFFAQVITVVACIAWNLVAGGLVFWLCGLLSGGNRVTEKEEIMGLDSAELGVNAYDDSDVVLESTGPKVSAFVRLEPQPD